MIQTSLFTKEQPDVLAVILAFGLRRKETESVRYKDITVTEEEITLTAQRFKGDKPRTVIANKTYEPELRKVIREKGIHNPEDLFIDHKISKYLNIHALRVEAAKALYKELKVDGQLSEAEILEKVTKFLGHSSTEVTLRHYLR